MKTACKFCCSSGSIRDTAADQRHVMVLLYRGLRLENVALGVMMSDSQMLAILLQCISSGKDFLYQIRSRNLLIWLSSGFGHGTSELKIQFRVMVESDY